MAESTKIKSVLIDGELADISTDNDNYAGIFTHEEQEVVEEPEKEEEKKKRRRWFGGWKRKDEADVETKEIDAESLDKDGTVGEKNGESNEEQGTSAESNNINAVLIDGELANVSIDNDTGLYTPKEQTVGDEPEKEQNSKRRRWFGAGKQKDEADVEPKEIDAESLNKDRSVGEKSNEEVGGESPFGNFAASLLNVCTFGLFSSSSNSPLEQPMGATEKILSDMKATERELNLIEEEMVESQQSLTINTPDQALVSIYSIASDDVNNITVDSTLSHASKKTKLNMILCNSIVVLLFIAMAGLFIAGGIFWKKNGW